MVKKYFVLLVRSLWEIKKELIKSHMWSQNGHIHCTKDIWDISENISNSNKQWFRIFDERRLLFMRYLICIFGAFNITIFDDIWIFINSFFISHNGFTNWTEFTLYTISSYYYINFGKCNRYVILICSLWKLTQKWSC